MNNAFRDHNVLIVAILIYGKRGMVFFEEQNSENR